MEAAAGRPPARLGARDLAVTTPDSRNRYVDLIRVASIGVVVVGHWLMAVLGWRDGGFTGVNLLELEPDLQIVTWVFQVMPLFFIVGGYTNALSWTSASRRGTSYADWLRGRCARLIRPAIWFVAFWAIVPAVVVALGLLSSGTARIGGQEVALPLWFLAVYVGVVAFVPPLLAAHRRLGLWLPVLLAAAALLTDAIHFGLDIGPAGVANYLFVWMAIIELGFLWRDGTLGRSGMLPWAMAAGGLATVVLLVGAFDYPVSMIGLTHAERSNVQPPTVALLALAVWQCGAAVLLQPAANRRLAGRRAWLSVVVANGAVMTLYLWNMSAVVLAAVLLLPTGVLPQTEPLTVSWWLLRLVWVLACAVCLIPFLLAARPAERPALPPGPAPRGLTGLVLALAGVAAASAGLAVLAAEAFPVPREDWALPAVGVAAVALGAVLLGVRPLGRALAPA